MPFTKKFKKLLGSTKRTYGEKKGTQIAHAISAKRGWRH
jgi:hypothetical protein